MEVRGTIRAAAAVLEAVFGNRDGVLPDVVAATMRGTDALAPRAARRERRSSGTQT